MEIFHSIEDFAKTGYECHVALGFFDGVHRGHRAVIDDCVMHKGVCRSAVLTFSESPARVMGRSDIRLLTDNDRKARLIAERGIDALIFADFRSIRELSAEEFITRVLRDQLRARRVVCGYNYRFGKDGGGDTRMLAEICTALGIEVSVKEPVDLGGQAVSSTAIREKLVEGDIEGANVMLGYRYSVGGRIGTGNHIGTKMGFPTVNLPIGEGLVVPRYGVYASRVTVDGVTYRGATNIGVHPTVGENEQPLCETFLLDFGGEELYGERAVCELSRFIRPERKFSSVDELTAQVSSDIETIKGIRQ